MQAEFEMKDMRDVESFFSMLLTRDRAKRMITLDYINTILNCFKMFRSTSIAGTRKFEQTERISTGR